MLFPSRLRNWKSSLEQRSRLRRTQRLNLEQLEDRVVPSVTMVKDIYSYTADSGPQNLTDVNGTLFFQAYDNSGNYNLYKSDGTSAGTQELTFGNRLTSIGNLVNLGGKLFFSAQDSVLGHPTLWTSDGTVAGTHPFLASGEDVIPPNTNSGTTQALVGNKLYFEAYDTANNQYDLWISDGTSAGTHPVQPGTTTEPTGYNLSNFTNVNGTLYFQGYDSVTGNYTLWKSNGTVSGTVQVAELTPYQTSNLTAVGSELYFEMYDSNTSLYALWKSNGSGSGTSLVADIGTTTNQFYGLTSFSSKLWFQVNDSTDAPNTGWALWSSDGTAANTGAFKFNHSTTTVNLAGNSQMIVMGSGLYFEGYDTTNSYSLWKTDGNSTNNATATVQTTGSNPFNQYPSYLTVVGSELFFVSYDSSNNKYDLWKSNGTSTAPVQTGSLVAQGIGYYSSIVASNGKAFFTANDVDTNGQSPHGYELWSSDGTAANTAMVADINTTTAGSNPQYLTAVGSEIFFGATDNTGSQTLYQSDGTVANTVPVQTSAHVLPDAVQWSTLTAMGSNLYFTALVPSDGGFELWSSGTSANSAVAIQAGNGNAVASDPFDLINDNGELYFFAIDQVTSQYALWKSNGTNAGTQVVSDINFNGNLSQLTAAGSNLFFQAYDTTNSTYALWESNGTTANQVQDISANGIQNMTAVGSSVFFQAYDYGDNLYALWTSNGTTTTQLTHFASGQMYDPIAFNNQLFFDAYDPANGYYTMWMSNGTVSGTQLYLTTGGVPVILGNGPVNPYFTVVGSELYFEYLFDYYQLGKTDGTPGGFVDVQAGGSGPVAQNLSYLANDNGTLVFQAYDSTHGYELWQSDGTAAGTLLTADINPGTASSSPSYLTVAGNQVFFNASDATHGAELWSATLAQTVVTAGVSGPSYVNGSGSTINGGVTEQHLAFVLNANDSNSGNNSAGFSFNINWGDGTNQTVSGQSGLTADHQYAATGNFTVSVTATNLADNVTSSAVTQVENISQTAVENGNLALGGVAGNNAWAITKGTATGNFTAKINGTLTVITNTKPATGEQVFLYSGNGTNTVSINDATSTSVDTFTIGNGLVIFNNATFVPQNPISSWTLNGSNANDTYTIQGTLTANIVAGSKNDTFKMVTGANLLGTINAGAGVNTLDYTLYTTSGVIVDLPLNSATAVDGGASGGITSIENVTGSGHGGDILVGDGNANVLKTLHGHNILIGGSGGGDTLTSNGSGDIMIAGSTNYDTNIAALQFILGEWAPVTATTYATVINNIMNSATDPLNATTVTDSGATDLADTLNGKAGKTAVADWYFAHTTGGSKPNDTINNEFSGETVTSI